MAHEGAPLGDDPELLTGADQLDARIDQTDEALADAEQNRLWEQDWRDTLTELQKWGPRFATAYRDARAEVGGTITPGYDGEGERLPFTPPESKAYKLQPDVLIVDLSMHERSLRHPLPGDVKEKVFAAGWTVLRREFPAPEGITEASDDDGEAEETPKAKAKKRVMGGLLDELVEIDTPAEDEDDAEGSVEPAEKRNMFVERIVVTQDGRIIRFVGRSDANPEGEGPLRFARVRPDENLKEEDEEKYNKQKQQLEDYMQDNEDHFVPREQFNAEELLSPDTILDAKLNALPQDAPEDAEDYELQSWMVREGLAEFLEKRGLAEAAYLADLRS